MRSLGEYFPDDLGLLDACEPLIKALEPERQPAVVDAEAVQDSRIQIIDTDRVRDHVVTEIIGFAMDMPLFHPAAGKPNAKVTRVVITSIVVFGERSLRIDGSPELTPTDDKRLF
jgi:hypothetical protein